MQQLPGMPERLHLRRRTIDGVCLIDYGTQVLFRFEEKDTGMRNVAVVAVTDAGAMVKDAAAVFGLTPEYVSELRGRARKEGSAGLVKPMGQPPKLSAREVTKVREGLGRGQTQTALAKAFKVSRPVIAAVLARHGVLAAQETLDLDTDPDVAPATDPDLVAEQVTDPDMAPATDPDLVAEQVTDPDRSGAHAQGPTGDDPAGCGVPDLAADLVPSPDGPSPDGAVGSGRIGVGRVGCRYAGSMLAHAFLHRIGAGSVFASLARPRTAAAGVQVFDDVALLCATTVAFGLGTGSVEAVKHLDRVSAGALAGLVTLPELRTLRPRLAAIADACDPLAVQTSLAAAMLAADAPALGIYFVDDHFVPYAGAKPFGKGWNTKRKTAMPGHGDTLVTDFRGRAVAFITGEPSGLTKTLPPVLEHLRRITGPDAPIMLGFDRGGAYASVFTACREQHADWITYRRGGLAATDATPVGHTYVDPDGIATRVVLADETIEFKDYGTCRQLTLYEDDRPVLQVLTSDMTAPAAALLSWLRARWRIENAFKDLARHHGIDWLCDYTADLVPDTTLVPNPARQTAKKTRDTAKTERDTAAKALADLVTTPTRPITTINKAIPAARRRLDRAQTALTKAEQSLKTIPAKIPADQATPGLMRAMPHLRRRTLQMVLRLLAYNAELWLADRFNTYLHDTDEYRAHLRNILHRPGTINYTDDSITVTLDRPATPKLTRALNHLTDELNHTPPYLPGDTRPITYHVA